MADCYDTVVIGSGIGGLCCGALLAKAGMKVLVLEQHSKIGGYAHNFKRRSYTFESGIHSVPFGPDGTLMHILKVLGIEKKIVPLEISEMYHVDIPEGSFTMPSRTEDINEFLRSFCGKPEELSLLINEFDRFYQHICEPVFDFENNFKPEDNSFVSQFHNFSYTNHLKSLLSNQQIYTLLAAQWPYSGISAEAGGALFSFTMFLLHYRDGSYYCKGGFSSLAQAFSDLITSQGGAVLTRQKVNKLIVENNRVCKVQTWDNSVFDTKIVVSNISPYTLHSELVEENHRGKRWLRRLGNLNSSVSCVIVYLGMKPQYHEMIPNTFSFWFETSDFNAIYRGIILNCKDKIDHLITLKGTDEGEYPTLTLMNFVQKSFSQNWHSDKMIIAEKMLNKLESLYPGIRKYIEIMEVGSPETFERYTGNTNGALYGFENVKEMYGEAKIPITTHIPNLFQTGHWGKPGCGVWNVTHNAYRASKTILNSMK